MENLRGALLMTLAMVGFVAMDGTIKAVSDSVPLGQILLFNGTMGALIFGALARFRGQPVFHRGALGRAVMLRNLFEMATASVFVLALALVPLATVAAIIQLNPILVTLGAILFLGERVGWRRWAAIFAGFAGVLIIIRPGLSGFQPASLIVLAAATGLAARDIATRAAPASVHPLQLGAWGNLAVAAAGILLLALWEGPRSFAAPDLALLGLGIILGSIGYYAIILAMRMGDVAVITPFRYTRLIFAFSLAWIAFGERPDGWTLIGSAVVVSSGLYTLIRERRAMARRPVP